MEKFRKKIFKSTKGITLIALVVTIIILLILAGVSIAMLTGNNGILTQGKRAKEETTVGHEKEAVQMAYAGAKAKKLGEEVTAEDVNEQLTINGENATATEGTNKIIVTFTSGKVYTIDQSGKITQKTPAKKGTLAYMYEKAEGCTKTDGTCTDAEHLHIGDYVNLVNPEEGKVDISATDSGMDNAGLEGITAQTFEISKTNNKNQLSWRVLGENENGEIELIAGSPMKSNNTLGGKENPYLYLYGAKAYENGETILDNICELYKTKDTTGYISSARSVNQKDIDKVVGLNSIDEIKNVNLAAYQGNKNIGEEYSFPDHYTPSSWLNGKTKTLVSGKVDGYGYTVNSKMGEGAPSVTVNDRIFKMLFENTDYTSSTKGGRRYWLASRSVCSFSDYAYFCLGTAGTYVGVSDAGSNSMFDSYGYGGSGGCAVRPVVSLKSSVTSTQVQKITDKTEDTWNVGQGGSESGGGSGQEEV